MGLPHSSITTITTIRSLHPLLHSLLHSKSPINLPVHSSTLPSTYLLVHPTTYSFVTHQPIYPSSIHHTHSLTRQSTHSPINPPIHHALSYPLSTHSPCCHPVICSSSTHTSVTRHPPITKPSIHPPSPIRPAAGIGSE